MKRKTNKEGGDWRRKVELFSLLSSFFFLFFLPFSANRFDDDLRFFALDNAPFEIPNVSLELGLVHRRGVMNII